MFNQKIIHDKNILVKDDEKLVSNLQQTSPDKPTITMHPFTISFVLGGTCRLDIWVLI